jgi:FkbM family methyltransferase
LRATQRIRFARERSQLIRPISQGRISAFLFFFTAGAGRPWRFHMGPLSFYARYRDWVALEEIALQQEYSFVASLLHGKERPRVVDLGAHIGLFSLFVLDHFPSAVIHSVEASRETYDILRRNRKLNGRLAWEVHWGAMWNQDGEISFDDEEKASTGHHIDFSGTTGRRSNVPAISLSTLLRERVKSDVDILKVDIEGAEEAVLCEDPALLGSVGAVTAEIHPDRCNQRRVLDVLQDAYEYVYAVQGRRSSKPLVLAARTPATAPALKRL